MEGFCHSVVQGFWSFPIFCSAVAFVLVWLLIKLYIVGGEGKRDHETRVGENNNNDIGDKVESGTKLDKVKMRWEEIEKKEGISIDILNQALEMESEEDALELLTIKEKWKIKLISESAPMKEDNWKRKLILECQEEWKGELISKIDFEEAALSVVRVKEEWRAKLIKDVTKGQQWKIKMIENAISKDCADKIDRNSEKWKCELMSKVSAEESWKISLIDGCSIDKLAHLIFSIQDEDKAEILSSTTALWKINFMEKCLEEDPWKLDLLSSCNYKWQGEMILKCHSEDKANMVKQTSTQWKAKLLMEVADDLDTFTQHWKINLISKALEYWRCGMILKESRENVAEMILKANTRKKAEAFSNLNRTEEWRLKQLDIADSEWKINQIAAADTEVKALAINICRYEGVGKLMKDVEEEWKLINMTKTEEPWRAEIIKQATEEWQARLTLSCQSKDMEIWRVSKIPLIKDETIAVHFLFNPRLDKIPVWKFELCVQISQNPSELSTCKVEKLFHHSGSGVAEKWKANMIADVEEHESWKVDILADIKQQSVAQQVSRCSDEDKARLVAITKGEWQAKLVAESQEPWKTVMLARSDMVQWRAKLIVKEKSEWKAAVLACCEEEWRAELIVNAEEEWKVNLLDKSCSKVGYKHKNDEWRYRLIAEAETEWKAITLGEVEEQWRTEMIAKIPNHQEWKSNLFAYHGNGREEQWRLKLAENLEAEWQVKMLLLARNCTQVWKATMIANLGPKDQKRANEILECHTEEFALQVLNGEFDNLYV